MRKFRYGDPASQRFKKLSTLAYIFLSWNVLGFVVYTVWNKKKKDTDPEWTTLSSTDKYLSMMTVSKNVERVKISGFKKIERTNHDTNPSAPLEKES